MEEDMKKDKERKGQNPGSEVDKVTCQAAPLLLARHMKERMRQWQLAGNQEVLITASSHTYR